MVKVVEQGLYAEGRVDVGQLVMGAVDTAVGKEVDGVVLPRPKLRAAAQEWTAAADTEVTKVAAEGTVAASVGERAATGEETFSEVATAAEVASERVEATAVGEETAAKEESAAVTKVEEADEAPKAPADLIARVLASIKEKQQAKAADGPVARVLASTKGEQAAEGLGWSGGGGHMLKCILEGMTFQVHSSTPFGESVVRLAWPVCSVSTTIRRLWCD